MSAAGSANEKGKGPLPLSAPSGATPSPEDVLRVIELGERFVTTYGTEGEMTAYCVACPWTRHLDRGHVTETLQTHDCEASR